MRWGLSDEEVAAVKAELGHDGETKLWAMYARAFAALCAAGTQWRFRLVVAAEGFTERVVGLDYAGVKVALDALGLVLSADDWRALALLEREAARALNGEAG